jgi:hypothetical protein
MKENLNKIIIPILVIEIITLLFSIKVLLLGNGRFITFWGIATLLINISAIYLLLKYKPKLYQLTSVICLLVFMLLVTFLFVISGMGC